MILCDIDRVFLWLFSAFQLVYMTLAVHKMDGRGLSNTACCECLPVPATEGTPDSSNKMEHFSYKSEYIGECIATHLKEG